MPHRSTLVRASLAIGAAALLSQARLAQAETVVPRATSSVRVAERPSAAELAAGACRLGRWSAALDLMRIVERSARRSEDWLCLARAQFHTGQWVAALDSYDELAEAENREEPSAKAAAGGRAGAGKRGEARSQGALTDGEVKQLGAIERQELEQKLGWIEIAPSGPVPASLKLSLDGEVISRSRIGVPFPVQPGTHAFSVEARGELRELDHWRIAEGEHVRVNLSLPVERAVMPRNAVERQPNPLAVQPQAESSELSRWARRSLYAGGIGASVGFLLLGSSSAGGSFHPNVFYAGVGSFVFGGVALLTGAGLYLADSAVGDDVVADDVVAESAREAPAEPERGLRLQPWISSNGAGVSGQF